MIPLLLLIISFYSVTSTEQWDIWPIFTPVLGVSDQCRNASYRYIQLVDSAIRLDYFKTLFTFETKVF